VSRPRSSSFGILLLICASETASEEKPDVQGTNKIESNNISMKISNDTHVDDPIPEIFEIPKTPFKSHYLAITDFEVSSYDVHSFRRKECILAPDGEILITHLLRMNLSQFQRTGLFIEMLDNLLWEATLVKECTNAHSRYVSSFL